MSEEKQEKDYLTYTGNKVPRIIRLAWTLFVVFMFAYLGMYAWPDLMEWMKK